VRAAHILAFDAGFDRAPGAVVDTNRLAHGGFTDELDSELSASERSRTGW
jgi:hypothetical protein